MTSVLQLRLCGERKHPAGLEVKTEEPNKGSQISVVNKALSRSELQFGKETTKTALGYLVHLCPETHVLLVPHVFLADGVL